MLLIDKPYEWTSFDAVNKIRSMIRYLLGVKKIKIGHAGTLDPLATGLLIVCTGKFTRQIEQYQGLDKTYTGTFTLGQTTPSFDLETPPDKTWQTAHIDRQLLEKTAGSFLGTHDQMPPMYSAKKVEGKRAYAFARRGETTRLRTTQIHISEFEITWVRMPEAGFRVVCSKGTYIRALARDFGHSLSSGATLTALRRTHIGSFCVEQALQIGELEHHLRQVAEGGADRGE